jgi:molybdopterin/thiamine biosynthesis adenylyltransferase
LLLGVGGLGSGVAVSLARLGVKKLILIDKDVVDPSNLNRQLLFSPQHVGKPKVEVAAEILRTYH